MYCSACGMQLEDSFSYCHRCGRPTRPDRTSPWGVPKTLSRPLWEKKIGGVCAGFARYFDVDVTLMRILWLVVALFSGVGFIAYLIAWIAMPAEPILHMPPAGFTPGQEGGASPDSRDPLRSQPGGMASGETQEAGSGDSNLRFDAQQA